MSRTPWRDFARDIARLAAPPDAQDVAARHTTVEYLPDLLSAVTGLVSAAEGEAHRWRTLLLSRAIEVYADPRLSVERSRGGHPDGKRWRVFSEGCPVGYGVTEGAAILAAIEARAAARSVAAAADRVEEMAGAYYVDAHQAEGDVLMGAVAALRTRRAEGQPEEPVPAVTR